MLKFFFHFQKICQHSNGFYQKQLEHYRSLTFRAIKPRERDRVSERESERECVRVRIWNVKSWCINSLAWLTRLMRRNLRTQNTNFYKNWWKKAKKAKVNLQVFVFSIEKSGGLFLLLLMVFKTDSRSGR
jgi:hypothetical protein